MTALLDAGGGLRRQSSLPVGPLPSGVLAGHLDGDGLPDVLVPLASSNQVVVCLGRPGGDLLARGPSQSTSRPKDLALGDLDGDSRPDLAVLSTEELAIQRGLGGGDLGAAERVQRDETCRFGDVVVADLDGDSRADLAAAESSALRGIVFHRGLGDGRFEPVRVIPLAADPVSLHLADLDGDGLLDLTTANRMNGSVSVVLGQSGGDFAPPRAYRVGFSPLGHVAADLDGDGAVDLAAFSSLSVRLLRGRPGEPAHFRRGDVDGDGRLEVNDAIALLARLFLAGDPLRCEDSADADDDGQLSLSDAIAFLDHLFRAGPAPPAPGLECGPDPTTDLLACLETCMEGGGR
jgi:hypothetical protein